MTNVLESTIAWATPYLTATVIVVPVMQNKLRTRHVPEAMHQAREHCGE